MKRKTLPLVNLGLALFAFTSFLQAQPKITVEVNKPGHTISPTLFGIFFEDINNSTDGGIYPELVRNRSFENADTLQYWKFSSPDNKSSASILNIARRTQGGGSGRQGGGPLNPFNLKSLQINVNGSFKLQNDGYWGMNIVQGSNYIFKLAARVSDGFNSPLVIKVVSSGGKELASGEIRDFGAAWKYYPLNLTPSGSDPKAHLEISGEGKGTLYLEMVSLMPKKTWKDHGLRVDLAEAQDALNPAFVRFPGGSWVDGSDISRMYQWKNTIGSIDTRAEVWNLWRYYATNSIGYHEYLVMSEDLGAEPMFCINAGMGGRDVIPMDRMGPWIQDALDAIEYANGPVTSVWGGLRAKNGHPQPFNMKYIEIGNENGGGSYNERYAAMANAIHAEYPEIIIIANEWAGGHPTDPAPAILDEHYYNNPDWFIWNANKYDSYDRKGAKIFVGEYAVTSGTGLGNLRGAIGEAAFMIGMERNSDIVVMASYAPEWLNVNNKAWPVNLINFDSYRWFGLPSYYVQEMFANNQGTRNLPVIIENAPKVKLPAATGSIGFGTRNSVAEFKDVQVLSTKGKVLFKADFSKVDEKWRKSPRSEWTVQDGVLKPGVPSQQIGGGFMGGGNSIFMGDTLWKDYTVTLKARKVSGNNGFQIYFRNKTTRDRYRWDIGGSDNTTCTMEYGLLTDTKKVNLETGKWYDIKLEISGNTIKGYLNGKLVQEISDVNLNVKDINVSAAKDDKSGDIIVKVVNSSAGPVKAQISLAGATSLTSNGKVIVLTSASPLDENTLEAPTMVASKTEDIKFSGNLISRSFPGNSLTVIRLSTSK